ncbi:MAG: hypothetical protein A2161_17510 [Candidatus Schekmanbacteria bacterium RBG_13_48_7]|uniref:DUF2442 domain-containing protein n=1 Tax=Candidatus Schekmanbacteria bacterium RBG_13_48_7 TaxID=1817878 RepID=A0A1F7S1R0_9BACT|nr:MAG: hypothetical protein A2161_17510 [Candidatus Schekmanbacteria bacterium RBG_13_48_7]
MSIKIVKAEYLKEYSIKLHFSDKKTQVVNFKLFLENSKNPMTRKYLNIEKFKEFKIVFGDLVWHDYELCFPIMDLYENTIMHEMHSVA